MQVEGGTGRRQDPLDILKVSIPLGSGVSELCWGEFWASRGSGNVEPC